MEHELRDVLADPQAVVVIEWGDVVQHVLPKKRLTIQLSTPAEDNRILHYSYPDDLKYLVESTLKL